MDATLPALRALPAVSALLDTDEARALRGERDARAVTHLARAVIDAMRSELQRGELPPSREALLAIARARLTLRAEDAAKPALRRVINATGVVLHTNLGRAPLGASVMDDVREAVAGYAAVEYDLARGARGHRDAAVRPLLQQLTGAEDAVVVNNCAAAVLLACTAFAAGREVVVSRGELVEIGGGFRIPDVIASCGARLVEVGTTNRTRAADYERAIGERTGALLQVHRSNFAITGFTASASTAALAALARAREVPLLVDLGSGALLDTRTLGLPAEPSARDAIAAGADLVMFSGDKLLGGPQAGVLAGRAARVEAVRRHPLMRALRPGRLVLAALEAVLRRYADGRAARELPGLDALGASPDRVRARAERAAGRVTETHGATVDVVATEARVGGGTLPDATIPSWALRVTGVSATRVEALLRQGDQPVVGRRAGDALLLDLRAVGDDEVDALALALRRALARSVDSAHALGSRDASGDGDGDEESDERIDT